MSTYPDIIHVLTHVYIRLHTPHIVLMAVLFLYTPWPMLTNPYGAYNPCEFFLVKHPCGAGMGALRTTVRYGTLIMLPVLAFLLRNAIIHPWDPELILDSLIRNETACPGSQSLDTPQYTRRNIRVPLGPGEHPFHLRTDLGIPFCDVRSVGSSSSNASFRSIHRAISCC
jgi:hypothetical protein